VPAAAAPEKAAPSKRAEAAGRPIRSYDVHVAIARARERRPKTRLLVR
jgi:hypothetical protein